MTNGSKDASPPVVSQGLALSMLISANHESAPSRNFAGEFHGEGQNAPAFFWRGGEFMVSPNQVGKVQKERAKVAHHGSALLWQC